MEYLDDILINIGFSLISLVGYRRLRDYNAGL